MQNAFPEFIWIMIVFWSELDVLHKDKQTSEPLPQPAVCCTDASDENCTQCIVEENHWYKYFRAVKKN